MPHFLWPYDGIHLARVGEDIIILDVAADTYTGLLGASGLIHLEEDGSLMVLDDDVANHLEQSRVAQREASSRLFRPLTPPCREAFPGVVAHASLKSAIMVGELLSSTWSFKGKSLHALIYSADSEDRSLADQADDARVAAFLPTYRAALPWTPFEGECLQRGFQLKRLLRAHGIASDWVFGVKTWPFAAHCWIQIGDTVIGDTLERVRIYTPIMAA